MSDYIRRTTRQGQQGQAGQQPQRPSSMGEDEPAWEPGHPTQHEWGSGESGWEQQTRQTQGGMPERSMQGQGYTMPGQTYPQTGGAGRYGGPTTRSQGMRASRLGEEEGEPEDISKVYSEESRPSHEGEYLQGSQRTRQSRSQEMGQQMGSQQGSEHHGSSIMESLKDTAKKMTGRGHKGSGSGGSGSSGI